MHDLTFAMQFACLPLAYGVYCCKQAIYASGVPNFAVEAHVCKIFEKLVRGSLKFFVTRHLGLPAGGFYLPAACILSINRARNLIPSGSLVTKTHNSPAA